MVVWFAVESALVVELVVVAALLWRRRIRAVVHAKGESCVAAEVGLAAETGFVGEGLRLRRRSKRIAKH